MTLSVTHPKVTSGTINPTVEVDLHDWNDQHVLTGTADASQLNANVVQAITNDTNVTGSIAAQNLTLGWTGTLGVARGGAGADLSATGGAGQYLKQVTTGAAVTVGTIPASEIASGTALTKTDDTNVTLTLGGTPTTALLKATSITVGWTGTLAASRGGFGADISAQSGVPLFASGVATFTSTSGSGNFARVTSPAFTTPSLGTATSTGLTVTSTSANSMTVGPNGATNPVLQIDASTASQSSGLMIKGGIAGGTTQISAVDSTAAANLNIDVKGAGQLSLNSSGTGPIVLFRATTISGALTYGGVTLSNAVTGTGNMVLSASPTFTGTLTAAAGTFSSLIDISGASAGQLKFPAAQNASADVNTLDDYKEGTFTPTISFGGASVGITYSVQTGKYTKIGNVVLYMIEIILTSKGSSTGSMLISGLPIASAASGNATAAVQVNNFAAGAITTIQATQLASSSTFSFSRYAAGTNTALADTDLTNTSVLRLSGIYFV